jgi:DNA-binding MarR family transcriptional regulator
MDRNGTVSVRGTPARADCAGREACVARSLMTAANLLTRIGDRLSASIGLTSSRWLMLCTVSRCEGSPSIGALSEAVLLSVQNVSRMLGQMEADGLIERFTKPGSGRSVFVRLTARGEAALEQTRALADEIESWFLRGMSDEEVARIDRDLWRLSDNLRAMEDAQAAGELDAPATKGRSS